MKKIAFTLAEVLITLGIIGVVSAMTIPTLIKNYKAKELDTGLKKAYSTISQALNMYHAKNGVRYNSSYGTHELKPILLQYIINVRDCGWNGAVSGTYRCIPEKTQNMTATFYRTFNDISMVNIYLFDDGQFIMNDGMLVMIEDLYGGNKFISVDVNGLRNKPNKLGHDLFMFQIDSEGNLCQLEQTVQRI